MFSPKLILSPIDFSDFSLNALDAARDVATHYASEILLLHVVPMVPELSEYASNFSEGVYEHELIETAKQRLGELTVKLKQRGTGARSLVVLANHPAHEITRTAAAEKVDLIVIATHGLTGWRRLAFGSVAEKVVRTADCAVLVLHQGTAENPNEK